MQNRFTRRVCGCQSPSSLCARPVAGLALASLLAGSLAGLIAGPAVAEPPADSSQAGSSQAKSSKQAGDGQTQRAEDRALDPVPRTSNETIRATPFLRNALSRSHEGLEAARGPDGTLTMNLKGRFQSVTTATINADGGIEMRCGHDHESLEAFRAAHPDARGDAEPPGSEPAHGGEGGDER